MNFTQIKEQNCCVFLVQMRMKVAHIKNTSWLLYEPFSYGGDKMNRPIDGMNEWNIDKMSYRMGKTHGKVVVCALICVCVRTEFLFWYLWAYGFVRRKSLKRATIQWHAVPAARLSIHIFCHTHATNGWTLAPFIHTDGRTNG